MAGHLESPEGYPYVRTLKGVSLFELTDFDPTSYSERCPSSSWCRFIPFNRDWDASIWIEINRNLVQDFVSGMELLARWKQNQAYGHNIMPEIEAASIGPIAVDAFKRILVSSKNDPNPKPDIPHP